jgi:hypothetical protein
MKFERYEQRLLIFLTLKTTENDKKASNTLDKIVLINSMIEAVERSEKLLHIQRWNVPLFGTNQKNKG